MLSAVERDHLAGHRRRSENEFDGRGHLAGSAAAPERHHSGLALELFRALPRARQRRSRADPVDPDARGERERHGLRESPQTRLGQGVGDEVLGQVPHPLVEYVDDIAGPVRRQRGRHCLHQHEGRAQIGLHVPVPALPAGGGEAVMLENRGVVDQDADRPQRRPRALDQRPRLRFVPEIGGERHRAAAGAFYRVHGPGGLVAGRAVMDRDRMTALGEGFGDRPTNPPRGAGNQRGTRFVSRHSRKIACRLPRIKRLSRRRDGFRSSPRTGRRRMRRRAPARGPPPRAPASSR